MRVLQGHSIDKELTFKRFWFSPEAVILIMRPNIRIMRSLFYIPELSTSNLIIMSNFFFSLFSKVQFLCSTHCLTSFSCKRPPIRVEEIGIKFSILSMPMMKTGFITEVAPDFLASPGG